MKGQSPADILWNITAIYLQRLVGRAYILCKVCTSDLLRSFFLGVWTTNATDYNEKRTKRKKNSHQKENTSLDRKSVVLRFVTLVARNLRFLRNLRSEIKDFTMDPQRIPTIRRRNEIRDIERKQDDRQVLRDELIAIPATSLLFSA